MINVSYYMIMAFYVVLIGIFMMIGAWVGKVIKTAFEIVGFIVGGLAGIYVSYWLYQNYGKQMIMYS